MENQITPEDNEQEHHAHSSPWKNLGIALSVLAIIVLFGAYYVGMNRVISINKKIARITNSVDSTVSQNQGSITTLQKDLADMQQNLQQARDELAAQQNTISDLKNSYQSKSDDWAIEDAQFLVKEASVNLEIGDNIALVIRLLQSANQELQSVSDPNINPLRKALADDILSLQAIPTLDRTGIYLQLNALNAQVDKLPLNTPTPAQPQVPEISKKMPWWKRGWQATLNSLQKIVIVRHNQDGVRPFILPDEQEFLLQNIHAMFEQAMAAVVHRQPEIYKASLLQAKTWIEKYFQTNSPLTTAQLSDLDKLQGVNLRPTLPTLTSVQAFHDFAAQHTQPVKQQ